MACTRAIIHLNRLRANLESIRTRIGPIPDICLAVKADAYGHGAVQTAFAALECGVSWLAVATPEEAVELRDAGIAAPILLLGTAAPECLEIVVDRDVRCVVGDERYVAMLETAAKRIGKPAKLHLEVDTGMGRTGCNPESTAKIVSSINRSHVLELDGICTHFADAETDREFTFEQIARLKAAVSGIEPTEKRPILHAANSAGAIAYPEARFDMVRPGIAAYGYPAAGLLGPDTIIQPVMEFVSKVVYLKRVPANTPLSYGMTYRTVGEATIATVGAGYADGYSRLLSNRGEVVIRMSRHRVAGTVCMDQFMVDLGSSTNVEPYDDVVLFGPTPPAHTAADIAALIGTIPYEVLCGVGKRVVREYRG